MPTFHQLTKFKRFKKFRSKRRPALQGCPQKKGVCLKLVVRTPRKPNSAWRKLAILRLSNSKRVYAYIPGEGHNLYEYAIVLVQGGRTKDLPGIKYKLIRGKYDLEGLINRKRARSKFGTRKL